MGRWFDALKRVIVSMFTRISATRCAKKKSFDSSNRMIPSANLPVIILPPPPSAPSMPDFEFRASSDFIAALGVDVEFSVVNSLDLQRRCIADNVLVVEANGPNTAKTVMWFRYDTAALAARGVAVCRMYVDETVDTNEALQFTKLDWVGVCGWVMDRNRF